MLANLQNPRLFFIFEKDNAEKMFGYRVRYLGPEDDENEDMCFAYRGPIQKKDANPENEQGTVPTTEPLKISIMSPKVCETAGSPKVANSTTSQNN
jgi:hypothetical protein